MAQKYRVFIAGGVLCFGDGASHQPEPPQLIGPNDAQLLSTIEAMEAGDTSGEMQVVGDDAANWKRFSKHFKLIEAAGGMTLNQEGQWLMIHRLGKWDLPKGKLEKGETPEQAAVREVSEECGILQPTIIAHVTDTYHVYRLKGRLVLKRTYWYLMRSNDHSDLTPQREEHIAEARWVDAQQVPALGRESYGSVREVIEMAQLMTLGIR